MTFYGMYDVAINDGIRLLDAGKWDCTLLQYSELHKRGKCIIDVGFFDKFYVLSEA